MSKYRVVYLVTECKEEMIEANNPDEAKEIWENEIGDEELFFIEDENGNQIFYC